MNIKKKLQEIFRDIFDDDSIEIFDTMTSDDIEDWDSLTHINLILAIEQEFNIQFTTSEITQAKNVHEFMEIIEKKLG